MTRPQMIEQACLLGLDVSEYQDPQTGVRIIQRTFDVKKIKGEYRRLKAESEGFVVNLSAIFNHTNNQLRAENKI